MAKGINVINITIHAIVSIAGSSYLFFNMLFIIPLDPFSITRMNTPAEMKKGKYRNPKINCRWKRSFPLDECGAFTQDKGLKGYL